MVRPLAKRIKPSQKPFRFTEVAAFRGDFGATEVVNPKGIAYHPKLDKLIVSLSPFTFGMGKRVQFLSALTSTGARSWFAPGYQMFRDVEAMLVIVPSNGLPVKAGFTPGDFFVGRGPGDEISRLTSEGIVINDIFVDCGTKQGIWGGLAFDTYGLFGGRLIVLTTGGKVFLVDANGGYALHMDLNMRTEGVAVAPEEFGPLKGQIIIGVEGASDSDPESGKVYAIDKDKKLTLLADIGFAAEHIEFVPANGGTFYQCEICFDRERENRVLRVSPASSSTDKIECLL